MSFITLNLLESRNLKQTIFVRDIFSNHILIIALFILLTGLFTYPSYFEFDNVVGYPGDAEYYMNIFWWYNYNVKNPPEPFNFNWIFVNDYQFYPIGAAIGVGPFNTLLSILVQPFTGNFIHTFNIITYLSFIFTGSEME